MIKLEGLWNLSKMLSDLDRKGDTAVEPIVILSIAIIVLAVVGFGFYLTYSGQTQFFKFLPSFGLGDDVADEIVIFRYDVLGEELDYYDGIEWIPVKADEEIVLGKKRFDGEKVKSTVWNYFFNGVRYICC